MILAGLIPPPPPHLAWEEPRPSQWVVIFPIAVVALAMAATARHYVRSQQALALLRQGERLRAQHHDSQAMQRFLAAQHLDPLDDRAYDALGSLDLAEHRLSEALNEYHHALRLNPGSPPAEVGLAAAYMEQGNASKALHWLQAAVGKDVNNAQAQSALGDLFDQERLYPQALQHYEKAVQLNPHLAEAQNNLAWLLATCPERQYRDPQQALVHAKLAVSLTQGRQADYLDTLAAAYYANGQYSQALKTQQKAVSLDPSNRELQRHLARYRQAARYPLHSARFFTEEDYN